jgi:hypothetical protein
MPSTANAPSLDQRISVLRELVPLLPLNDPRPLFTEKGRGKRVTPWIHYLVSIGNSDDADRIATLLGTTRKIVFSEFEQLCNERETITLETRTVLEGLPSLRRVLDFEQFAAHHDSDDPPSAIWWSLCLPVLKPSLDVAFIATTLWGRFGGEDFCWLARKTRGGWTLEAIAWP